MKRGALVLDSHIDALSWQECVQRIAEWAATRQSRYVTLCNVHSVVTASQSPAFQAVIQGADLALPDGAPVAWALRHAGFPDQTRINGPDLMWRCLTQAAQTGEAVFFFGSTPSTLAKLQAQVQAKLPTLHIAGHLSPPFGVISPLEDQSHVEQINASGAALVFVGLGCPKQEAWMAAHRGRVQAVMLGVGAAFDYHAGTLKRAPMWMQQLGMEWLYRLIKEPRRLFSRYVSTNSIFLYRMARQALRTR